MGSCCVTGTEFQLGKRRKALAMDGGDDGTRMGRCLVSLMQTLQ